MQTSSLFDWLPAREKLLRRVLLPAGDRLAGQRMMQRLKFLEAAQWWDQERLQAERDRRLRQLVQVAAAEVPFYREILNRAGLEAAQIRSANDLVRLPVITKSMLRRQGQRSIRATGQRQYDSCSSGSTGEPFCVKEDRETAGWYRASFLLAAEWSGWHVGAPHLQMGMTLERSQFRWLKDRILRCSYVSAYDLSDPALDNYLQVMERHHVEYVWGYPGAVFFLARRALEAGWNRPLRSVLTWGDNLFAHQREAIQTAFMTKVFDTYGCAEGFQVAAQCGRDGVYHVHSLDVVVEYLADDGSPALPGKPGMLVITRLHAGPSPFIRYQVGDVAVTPFVRSCACGRGFETMTGIQGRAADVITTPSGNRLIVHFFTGVLEHFDEIETFQVVQSKQRRAVLRVVPGPGFTEEIGHKAIAMLQGRGAQDLEIELDIVNEIPLTAGGKRRFILKEGTTMAQEDDSLNT